MYRLVFWVQGWSVKRVATEYDENSCLFRDSYDPKSLVVGLAALGRDVECRKRFSALFVFQCDYEEIFRCAIILFTTLKTV